MSDIAFEIQDAEIDTSFSSSWERGKKLDAPKEIHDFSEELALALMLNNEVIFLNSHWWEETWPEDARGRTSLNVNCNDVFAWGYADAETLPHAELENLYRMWRKDPVWGAAIWCMIKRNQMPQAPVEKEIRKAGIWDLDKLGLGKNTIQAEVTAYLAQIFGRKEKAA